MNPDLLTTDAARKLLGLSKATFLGLAIRHGIRPAYAEGTVVRWLFADVVRLAKLQNQ